MPNADNYYRFIESYIVIYDDELQYVSNVIYLFGLRTANRFADIRYV